MNWLERWLLKRLVRRLVLQGPSHQGYIIEYYKTIIDAARLEFSEDNEPTLLDFLEECHTRAWQQVVGK